jgi:hypothetical protein
VNRYLTLAECAEELRITRHTVLKLLKQQRLVGIEITPGHWRIVDPAPKLREKLLADPLELVPFLSRHEAAEVLGMTPNNLRWYVDTGKAHPVRIEGLHFKVFTAKEVRRIAAMREKLRGPRKQIYSAAIARWLKGYLDRDADVTAEALQAMLDKAVKLPEPKRSEVVVEIWALVERLQEILREDGPGGEISTHGPSVPSGVR